MAPRRCRTLIAVAGALAASICAPIAAGQEAPAQADAVRRFTAPDGSRFVLIRDDECNEVHWAIAAWTDGRDDPPDCEGLARAVMLASLGGTWRTGSRDADAEREALARLDDSWQRKMASPMSAEIAREVIELDKAAKALADPRAFGRALAALPVFQPEVLPRDAVAVLVLTTIEDAIDDVGRLLVEGREQQALRDFHRIWMRELLQRLAARQMDPFARLHEELLALLMPTTPAARMRQQPRLLAPSREQAMATFCRCQHPSRTVHVVAGRLDLAMTQRRLERVFATTDLPAPPPQASFVPRPLSAQRRSIVPGIARGRVSVAWTLPAIEGRLLPEVAARWLGVDDSGQLQRLLRRRGMEQATVRCRAPWPVTESGRSLLLLDVYDPAGSDGLVAAVLTACRAMAQESDDGSFDAVNRTLQRNWNEVARSPRAFVAAIAEQALTWPDQPIEISAPRAFEADAVREFLRRTFAAQPAIVEGMP